MDVMKVIQQRHSYRGPYRSEAISRKDLEQIVEAGIRAPSGYNEQTTSFVIVDDAESIRHIAEIMNNTRLADAPALIVLCMDLAAKDRRNIYFGIEDYSAACENILLAATAMGYAGVWIDGALRSENRAAKIGEFLGVPSTFEVRVVVPLGVPTESSAQKERKPFSERAWFNRFGDA
jgi:nitroreductase